MGSAVYLVLTGNTGIRFSADHTDTVPMWTRWVPALAGLALAALLPAGSRAIPAQYRATPAESHKTPGGSRETPAESRAIPAESRETPAANGAMPPGNREATTRQPAPPRTPPYPQALVLISAAVAFAVSLRLAGGGEPAHTILKLALLLGVPATMFWLLRRHHRLRRSHDGLHPSREGLRRRHDAPQPDHRKSEPRTSTEPRHRFGPLIPVAAWFAISSVGPFATPPSDYGRTVDPVTLLVTIAVVFAVNAVLEEVFYRRWLQSSCEALLGRWPAIVLASLLWASWHIGIQGTGPLPDDLASVLVNQGVQGLFLGYLYSKHRRMWPILTVHGLTNSAPILLGLL
ncbi:CAAX prenyl protease-like protein [Saccharopolyspora erythraea NRRL 2338]|nr:CAAX prenyl protease-like protein [Saccharopolyspora erythraea NRRL 2338]